jgi:anthranilate phosphoribosyltransferase
MPEQPSDAGKSAPKSISRPVDFVKKVGRGKTLSQDLTPEESRVAFASLLDGAFSPAQTGAFLQALRIKELTQDELDGMMAVLFARMEKRAPLSGDHTLVLNLSSDTARKGGLVSLLAARLLPRFGVGAGVIRSEPVLSKNRKSFDETWALGDALEARLPKRDAAVQSPGGHAAAPSLIAVDCAELIPGLSKLDEVRGDLGFRSCLHTAEKLLNPWPASPLLLGISHKHYALRLAEAMRTLGLRGKILLGNHGTVDLVLHKETELVSVDENGIREESVSPADLGLHPSPDVYSLARLPQWREWLAARERGLWDALLYQLAVFLWAAGAARDPSEGLAAASRGLAQAV